MPTYEYRCTRCTHQFEVVHGVGKAVERCERCGGPVRRVFSPPALIFKGSGFHINDYRKTPAPSDDGKTGSAKTPADAKSSDAKSSDVKSSDAKSSGTKSSDSISKGTAASGASDSKKAS